MKSFLALPHAVAAKKTKPASTIARARRSSTSTPRRSAGAAASGRDAADLAASNAYGARA